MIQKLPQDLAEKIAAGEVIERPLSVIKELIENSIDAHASMITVEIEDGGKQKLIISDDGSGIHSDEMMLALERHATSKIQKLEDLWNLNTMGFRGEALPSIATISRFTLESRTENSAGRTVYLEGGKLCKDTNHAEILSHGTRITVENLFYNVPARLKFQRSRTGESSQIREMIEHFSLCHPEIGFKLITEGRKALALQPCTEEQRIAEIFDCKSEDLEKFQSQFEDIQISGFLDRNARIPNSKQIYVSANGRIVKDKLLQQAVLVALRPRMMEGEYPRLFLKVIVSPSEIDVNVHPTKSEVRFRRSKDVFQVIHGALSKLAQTNSKPYYATPSFAVPTFTSSITRTENTQSITLPTSDTSKTNELPTQPSLSLTTTEQSILNENQISNQSLFMSLKYIGQLKNTYLLFQDKDGLILIDQHAAHERIQYEKIKTHFETNGLNPKPLLIALTLKCKAEDIDCVLRYHDVLEKMGFEVEAFGDLCLIVRSIPEMLEIKHAQELFQAILVVLNEHDENSSNSITLDATRLSPKVERLLSTMACHSSIRAGQALSEIEAYGLLQLMDTTTSSLNCPHGRPASVQLSFDQIENLFKRS